MTSTAIPRYSTIQKALHWTIALLILWQFVSRWWEAALPKDHFMVFHLNGLHNLSGIAILVLTILRLVIRLRRGAVPLPSDMSPATQFLAKSTHALLYVLIIAQCITGMMAGPGEREALEPVHASLSFAMLAVVGLHVAAAIWHIQREDSIGRRMFRNRV